MIGAVREQLRALAVACVPGSARLGAQGWAEAEAIVSDALAERPPRVRRQIVLFVRVLGALSAIRFGRGLGRLEPEKIRRLLGWLERSPLLLLRRGTWGVRTLCFMGVYGQAAVRRALGYAPSLRGWEGRAISPGPWPDRSGAAPPEPGALTAGSDGAERGVTAPREGSHA